MKKIITFLFLFSVSFVFTGCGSDPTLQDEGPATREDQSRPSPRQDVRPVRRVGSAEPVRTLTCTHSSKPNWTYHVYEPGVFNSSRACELYLLEDRGSNPDAEWRANNDRTYCVGIMLDRKALHEVEGYSCTDSN